MLHQRDSQNIQQAHRSGGKVCADVARSPKSASRPVSQSLTISSAGCRFQTWAYSCLSYIRLTTPFFPVTVTREPSATRDPNVAIAREHCRRAASRGCLPVRCVSLSQSGVRGGTAVKRNGAADPPSNLFDTLFERRSDTFTHRCSGC